MTIHLQDLKFSAFHGLHTGEGVTGSGYTMNISIETKHTVEPVESLEQTIDYVKVYQIAKRHMMHRTPLLETIVMNIANDVAAAFEQALSINISLFKEQAPIEAFDGRVGVSHTWKRTDG